MKFFSPSRQPGRRHHGLRLTGAVLLGGLGLTSGSLAAAFSPGAVVGATNPASLNGGTLVISGTDGNQYQFTEFTTGNATRGTNVNSGGSVAYGGDLSASNFTVAQSITPPPSSLTAIVSGNETGQLTLQTGRAVGGGGPGVRST